MRTGVLAGLLMTIPAAATAANAANAAQTHYTHSTTLKRDCPVYENVPKAGVPTRAWTKKRASSTGKRNKVGVRYTYKGYALVLDYARKKDPSWGFIPQSCLTDPYAHRYGDHG